MKPIVTGTFEDGRGNPVSGTVTTTLLMDSRRVSRQLAEGLAFHLVSAHCNAAGLSLDVKAAVHGHRWEHFGPGGLRNHPYESHHYDAAKLEEVLEEAEEMECEPRHNHDTSRCSPLCPGWSALIYVPHDPDKQAAMLALNIPRGAKH